MIDTLSFVLSLKYLAFSVQSSAWKHDVDVATEISFNNGVGIFLPEFHAAGWSKQAQEVSDFFWGAYVDHLDQDKRHLKVGLPRPGDWVNQHANPYLVHKPVWFSTMTCVEPAIWRDRYGYAPDPESLGPYHDLARVWDDPDPANVRDALAAVRELNVATAIRDTDQHPEGHVPYMVDGFLLLYDYDVRSVNMRRLALGLEPVDVETYIFDYDLPLASLPFAIDDVFYPAYRKICEEIGVEPYTPETPITVRLDVENVRVERA